MNGLKNLVGPQSSRRTIPMKRKSASQSAFFNLRTVIGFTVCLAGVSLALLAFGPNPGGSAMAQQPKQQDQSAVSRPKPDVVRLVGPVSQDRDLRTLRQVPQGGEGEDEIRLTRYPRVTDRGPKKFDSFKAMQKMLAPVAMPTPLATYPGITSAQSGCGCLPPDTDGDVGPNHYMQAVNSRIKIISKTGTELLAPTTYNTFFSALGPTTPCGTSNQGDGVVFYDHLADRWVVSDFAFTSFPGVSFYQCIGVSKTSDPVAGGWWLYALQVDPSNPNFLGDYPKFGLWPDAYYLAVNLFSNGSTFNGVRVYALPRLDMINGTGAPTPAAVAFTISAADIGAAYSLVPAGFRTGDPPPLGTPEYILAIDSPATGGVPLTQVHAWRFHVDFATPANSTFGVGAGHTQNAEITVNSFVDAFTDTTSHLAPNGTATTSQALDTLGDKIMYPLVYQNLCGVESLWASHTVNNTGPTAVRWYQFNVTGGTIPAAPVQQQTFDNGADGLYRWMPSIAVDAQGNTAIGYSTSSTTLNPEVRYAGRLATDALNNLAQGETGMQTASGHQTSTSGRWGDYSALAIDPADNATFWHTNEYYTATSGAGWNTRIGNFRFPVLPLQVFCAVSRKTQGSAGTFDIFLPADECRSGGATGDYSLVVTLNNKPASGNASILSGTATISGTPTFSGNEMTVNLTGVANAQTVTVTLSGVTDVFSQVLADTPVSVKFLIGDTNNSSSVTSSDIAQVKGQLGQNVTGSNFRTDVNANGSINGTDVALVKLHLAETAK